MNTPKTDAAETRQATENGFCGKCVPASFARELEHENTRLKLFADAVREIALKPIDASDAMDELDTLLGSSYFSANVREEPCL